VLRDREEFSLVCCGLVEMAVQYVQTAIQVGVGDLSSLRREIAESLVQLLEALVDSLLELF
jgi:hypothetical protein